MVVAVVVPTSPNDEESTTGSREPHSPTYARSERLACGSKGEVEFFRQQMLMGCICASRSSACLCPHHLQDPQHRLHRRCSVAALGLRRMQSGKGVPPGWYPEGHWWRRRDSAFRPFRGGLDYAFIPSSVKGAERLIRTCMQVQQSPNPSVDSVVNRLSRSMSLYRAAKVGLPLPLGVATSRM